MNSQRGGAEMDETGERPREGKKQFFVAFGIAFVIAFAWILGFPWLLRGLKALVSSITSQP
jgi:hypothetical protein